MSVLGCLQVRLPHLIFSMAFLFLSGIASLVVSFLISVYYNVINTWAIWYLFHSFQVSRGLVIAGTIRGEDSGLQEEWRSLWVYNLKGA